MSDRIAVMNRGRVEQVGAPEEVYERPTTTFVAGFIGVSNLMPATVCAAGPRCSSTAAPRSRPRPASSAPGEGCAAVVRPEKLRIELVDEARAADGSPAGRGRGRELGLPRHRDPDDRRRRRRGADDRARPQRRRGRAAAAARRRRPRGAQLGARAHARGDRRGRTSPTRRSQRDEQRPRRRRRHERTTSGWRWPGRARGVRRAWPPAAAASSSRPHGGGRRRQRQSRSNVEAKPSGRADDLQLAALHRQTDRPRLRKGDRRLGQVHRRRQRQRRVLRQDAAAARPTVESGGRSLFVVTDWMAKKMNELGYLQKFDTAAIPNFEKNLVDNLRGALLRPGPRLRRPVADRDDRADRQQRTGPRRATRSATSSTPSTRARSRC